jgi:hypothetical protein
MAAVGPDLGVVGRILESDHRLAEVSSTADQVGALADMAEQLRSEAMRLAREGTPEDVMLVTGLYERVVCHGIVTRMKALPAEQQQGLVVLFADQLKQAADQSDRAALSAGPGARLGLRNLSDAARTASRSLSGDGLPGDLKSPAWQPARSGTTRDLLGTVVLHGLRLAEENDPLRRADSCNEVAEHLVQGILLASGGGDTERAGKLGGFLGSLMDRGVAPNLQRFQDSAPADARIKEAEQVGERSVRAVEVLQEKLERAPAVAQPGLQKALEMSSNPQPSLSHDGKGKKPKGLPPGLLKALMSGRPLSPAMQKKLKEYQDSQR